MEFPPHKLSQETPLLNGTLDLFDETFAATVHDYEALAETSLRLPVPDYPLIKTIVPGWDNEPRREGKSLALHGATPAKYQYWLENLLRYSAKNPFHGEQIVCVNAWNEWAEGAFLEPDLHFGAAFLNATARALCPQEQPAPARILLIGHDAHPHARADAAAPFGTPPAPAMGLYSFSCSCSEAGRCKANMPKWRR